MAYQDPSFQMREAQRARPKRRRNKFTPQPTMAQAQAPQQADEALKQAVGIGTTGQIQQAVGNFDVGTVGRMQQLQPATSSQPTMAQAQAPQGSGASATGSMGPNVQGVLGQGAQPTILNELSRPTGIATRGLRTNVNQMSGVRLPDGAVKPDFSRDIQEMNRALYHPLRSEEEKKQIRRQLLKFQQAGYDTSFDQGLSTEPQTMSQAADEQLMDTLVGGSQLGGSDNLDLASQKARERVDLSRGELTDPTGSFAGLVGPAEQVLRQRLQGGSNPLVEQQRADFLRRSGQEEDALMERLNRMGVLRGGDTAEALGDFIGARERSLKDIDALGYDMQSQALQDVLGFQGRRDVLGLESQRMQREAMRDLSDVARQQDERDIARSGLQSGVRGEAYGRQSQLDALTGAEEARRLARGAESRAERALGDDLLTSQSSRELARSAEGRALGSEARQDRLAQQEILDRILGRDISGRQVDMQAERQASELGLASSADERAERALQQDILGQSLARQATRAGMTGQFEGRDTLQGIAARGAEERAERALASDLLTSGLGREIAEAGQTGIFRRGETQQERRQQAELDALRGAEERAESTLAEDLRTSGLARRLAEAEATGELEGEGSAPARRTQAALRQEAELNALLGSEGRAERQLDTAIDAQDLQNRIAQAGVTGMFEGEGSQRPQRSMALQALEAEQALRGDEFDLRRRLAEAEQTGRYAFGDQADAMASRQGEITRAEEADRRSQQMLESDLESRDLQRRLAEAGQTGRFVFADPRDEIESRQLGETTQDAEERAFRRQLAEAGLTGRYGTEDTLQRQLAEGELLGEFGGETTLQRRLAEADRTGRLAMDEEDQYAMRRGVSTQDAIDRGFGRMATEAGFTGQFRGEDTMAERALGDQLRTSDLSRRLAEAEVTGELEGEGSQRARSTLAKQALESDLSTQDLARRLSEAEQTGFFGLDDIGRPIPTMAREAMDFERDRTRMGSLISAADLLNETDRARMQQDIGSAVTGPEFEQRLRRLLGTGQIESRIDNPYFNFGWTINPEVQRELRNLQGYEG